MTTIAHKYQLIDLATLNSKIDNIPGSKWVPVDALNEKVAQKNSGKEDMIVCYCGGGECKSSLQAADKLAHMGYAHVFAYEGGLKEWSEAGLPLTKI